MARPFQKLVPQQDSRHQVDAFRGGPEFACAFPHVAGPSLEFREDIAFAQLIYLVELQAIGPGQQVVCLFRCPPVRSQKPCVASPDVGQPERALALNDSRRKLQENLLDVVSDLCHFFPYASWFLPSVFAEAIQRFCYGGPFLVDAGHSVAESAGE